ncbi:MAG: photosynthetic reaction center subunit H [Burkholderiaceae bacterium]|jgi:photosynthetic reaction center H subunit|nr:photosynthetic reaction center subunit H [Burkholderiaceae bacterium]
MGTGAITQYVDVAQLVLYLFWAFFAGLIYYLVRENHREGYPMDSGRADSSVITGWPTPAPKVFRTEHGDISVPDPRKDSAPVALAPIAGNAGTAFEPTGNPMRDGVGPGAWTPRADVPDETLDGEPKIRPLRVLAEYGVARQDTDPRGLEVVGADNEVAGTVRDAWLDTSEMLFRYLEVAIDTPAGPRHVLLPMNFARVKGGRDPHVKVHAILAAQFTDVPLTRAPDIVTLLEEEKIVAYYGAGTLYATPERAEPLA